ncbi:MAG: hypothetical protein OXF73_03570 [Gammaproteobacteria bacterium]|nr:hypothetical protein [Gammaproteobacteria bacterium]MCY4227158.1 hypothetical protein [Gammaproteobacteria bacterium]
MTEHSGFPDIRIGHTTRGIGDEGVWPSFTDIMAVIVMIFLMALAVIMVQKLDLSRELVVTQSNQQEAERSRDIFQTQFEQMRIERDLQEREIRAQQSQLEGLKSEIGSLESTRDQLENTLRQIALDKAQAELQIARLLEIEQELEQSNLEAENRIRQFLAAEELSQEKVESLISQNQKLLGQITGLERQLSDLELASVESIQSLTEQRSDLEEKLDTVTLQLVSVQQLLDQSALTNQELESEISRNLAARQRQAEEYRITAEQMEALENLIRLMELKIVDLEEEAGTSKQQFRTLQEEYELLDDKYQDLVRPARSEAGKQVATVFFDKIGGELNYRIREPGQDDVRTVGLADLNGVLQGLKDQLGQELYVRIVIPENSVLSHREAWLFTDNMLRQYDYYYQPEARP